MCGVMFECSYFYLDGKSESFADKHIKSNQIIYCKNNNNKTKIKINTKAKNGT